MGAHAREFLSSQARPFVLKSSRPLVYASTSPDFAVAEPLPALAEQGVNRGGGPGGLGIFSCDDQPGLVQDQE